MSLKRIFKYLINRCGYTISRIQPVAVTNSVITSLYLGLLNRLPEEGVVSHLTNRINSGTPLEKITLDILESDEFKKIINLQNIPFAPPGHFYSPIVDTISVECLFHQILGCLRHVSVLL